MHSDSKNGSSKLSYDSNIILKCLKNIHYFSNVFQIQQDLFRFHDYPTLSRIFKISSRFHHTFFPFFFQDDRERNLFWTHQIIFLVFMPLFQQIQILTVKTFRHSPFPTFHFSQTMLFRENNSWIHSQIFEVIWYIQIYK